MRWGAGGRFAVGFVPMVAVAVVAASAGLAACSDGEASTPGATVPETLPETTTTTIDVTVVPDEITVAYADAVMDELDRLLGDAIRELVRARGPNERFYNLLNAVYDEPSFENKQSLYGEDAAAGLPDYPARPGDPETTVVEILAEHRHCMLLRVTRSFAETISSPAVAEPVPGFVVLSLKHADSDPASLNSTPWSITFDGDTESGDPPSARCDG